LQLAGFGSHGELLVCYHGMWGCQQEL
jgi:hypothetical protein